MILVKAEIKLSRLKIAGFSSLFASFLLACNADFEMENSYNQVLELDGAKTVVLTCYCPNEIDIIESETERVELFTVGKYGSQGYHGEQEKPSKIPDAFLIFDTETVDDTLRLVSNEWTMMHHYFMIEEVKISLPKGVGFSVRRINGNDLEGRRQ